MRSDEETVVDEPAIGRGQKGTGANRAYDLLRRQILTLEVAPGAELEEAALVAKLGLSRTPIREAMVRLAGEGLIVMQPNRSAQVAPIEVAAFPRYIEALSLLQRCLTRFAAERRTEDDLRRIETACEDFEVAIAGTDTVVMTESNMQFHRRVGEAAHNSFLSEPYERLLSHALRLLRIPFAYDPAGEAESKRHVAKIVAEHREILEAIRRRDAERAEVLAASHAELFRSRLILFMQQNAADAIRIAP